MTSSVDEIESNPVFHYDNASIDAAKYYNLKQFEIDALGEEAYVQLAHDWISNTPQTWDELVTFYENSSVYVFDLLRWHKNESGRRIWVEQLLAACEHFNLHNVLDFGCGIGSDGMVLAQAGHNVTLSDVNCEVFNFAKWRCNRYGLPITFITQPKVITEQYDLIICVDVLEHLGPVWPMVLENLVTHAKMMAVSAPFQNPGAPNEYQPQHFEVGNETLEQVMTRLDWRPISDGWGLMWIDNTVRMPEKWKPWLR